MTKSKRFLINLSVATILGAICFSGVAFAAEEGTVVEMPGQVKTLLKTAVNWLTLIAGSLALIFIIVGGINFMTANGDPAKVKLARDMILYAFVGIILVAIAQVFWSIANSIGSSLSGSGLVSF